MFDSRKEVEMGIGVGRDVWRDRVGKLRELIFSGFKFIVKYGMNYL